MKTSFRSAVALITLMKVSMCKAFYCEINPNLNGYSQPPNLYRFVNWGLSNGCTHMVILCELAGCNHPGISVHSKTTIQYLLPEDVQQFVSLAGIDDRARGNGNVLLTILGDGKKLYSKKISGKQQPEQINLNARKLIDSTAPEFVDWIEHYKIQNGQEY